MALHTVIFDFDSTLISLESLDEIIKHSIDESGLDDERKQQIVERIEEITDMGMNGEIDLSESLKRRLEIAKVHEKHIDAFTDRLKDDGVITQGMQELINNLHEEEVEVVILSGGLKQCLKVAAGMLGVKQENVFGNDYLLNEEGYLTEVDSTNPLSTTSGKSDIIKQLRDEGKLQGTVTMVGDGMSDLHPYEKGLVDRFIGFGVHKVRPEVEKRANLYAKTVDELASMLLPS